MTPRPVRVAYLVTHPIQYQAPLLRLLADDPEIDLTVFFCSDLSVQGFVDPGFGRSVEWDVPLLDGYKHVFLPAWGDTKTVSITRPLNHGLLGHLVRGKYDVFWAHGFSRPYNLLAIIGARFLGKKVLVRDESSNISARRGPAKVFAKKLFFRILDKVCHGFLAIGTLNTEYYLSYGIPKRKLFLVPYAVDNAFFQHPVDPAAVHAVREELRLDPDRPVILFASKFIERKCPLDLLNAYIALSETGTSEPRPYLLFVGDGLLRGETERQARDTGWSSIKFLGFRNQTELPPLFALSDVFVLPSVLEPWGLVVNEVMNAGKAVIVTDQVGCAPDLVKDGRNGYVVPAHDITALTTALKAATQSRAHCDRLGKESLAIIDEWGLEQDVAALKLAFKTVLNDKSPRSP